MKKLTFFLVFILAALVMSAQDDWIEIDSDLNAGRGVGNISVGINNANAFWAMAIDNGGAIVEEFSRSIDGGMTWTQGSFNAGDGLSMLFAIDENTICRANIIFHLTTWADREIGYEQCNLLDCLLYSLILRLTTD